MSSLAFLAGYPPELLSQAEVLIQTGKAEEHIRAKYPEQHNIHSNKELFAYVQELKGQSMQNAPPLRKVSYDSRMTSLENALGMHTTRQVAHGGTVRKRREMTVASLFRNMPAAFLRMIVVHELSHIKYKDHNRAFYNFCCHLEPDYHELEFDLRVLLCAQDAPFTTEPNQR